jgi:hypothetical protein
MIPHGPIANAMLRASIAWVSPIFACPDPAPKKVGVNDTIIGQVVALFTVRSRICCRLG